MYYEQKEKKYEKTFLLYLFREQISLFMQPQV